MNIIEKRLKDALYPLYEDLLRIEQSKESCTFCVQWGKDFPEEGGVLFVGKAVNEWFSNETKMSVLFGMEDMSKRIFARDDQMVWVKNNDRGFGKPYDVNRSAFWRVVKRICNQEDWYKHVAWTNLYKRAPAGGNNPTLKDRCHQWPVCEQIFNKELEILLPKYVIMFTSGWEQDFALFQNTKPEARVAWGKKKKYCTCRYKKGNTRFIVSHHPQGKDEQSHADAILELMK
jgi:hypothetical protein